ncbi:MAG: TerB family tellurite resistance protein [Caldilineaceae bacterium]
MFERFLRGFLAPAPKPLDAYDTRLALSALMVRVARADDTYNHDEAVRIERVLVQHFGLTHAEAEALRMEAEGVEAEAPDTVRFTRALKETVALEDRAGLMTAMWAVALADGVRDADEEALLRMVASLLGLTDVESALARQRAAE